MAFKKDNPDWKSYAEDSYYMKTVPYGLWDELQGLVRKASSNERKLKAILNTFAEILPCGTTESWSWSFLEGEIRDFVFNIKKKVDSERFDKFMDCLAVLVNVGDLSVDELNDFLDEHKIGYCYEKDPLARDYHWIPREESSIIADISATQEAVKSVSQQAYEEFERAKKSLEEAGDERARKDAVRSCLDALEAVVKEYGGDDNIKNASKKLRDAGSWGLDDIVKEGDALFSNMHRLYPDLRHGSTETSSMSIEEAEYWIGRFSNYLRYMQKMAEKNGVC